MAISVIEYPNGKFGFVGSVPVNLAYRFSGASALDRNYIINAIGRVGPGIAKKLAIKLGVKMEAKSFETRAEAYDVAAAFVAAHNLDVKVFG